MFEKITNSRLGKAVTLITALSLASLTGCSEKKIPKSEFYKNKDRTIAEVYPWGNLMLVDIDLDGKVDSIRWPPQTDNNVNLFVAPGYEKNSYGDSLIGGRTLIMPDSLREAASRVMRYQKDLSYQIAKARGIVIE
ncbi:MAG TPA: hypothetical protein VJJ23_01100 [Candidatus Nanoarchaeia archaeon]|nr:hypothetical protein [uncultured archaeon]AQS34199.1 hypothetical protein [uncultured archaeon]HLC55814.1 hypothetical protein [Candidatus Nanoarchaeia archaeon]